MVHPLRESGALDEILADARINAVVVGPGAGISDTTKRQALQALASKRAVVLDADAISVFGSDPQSMFDAIQGPCVLTPHEGEFNRLFSTSGNKLERARHRSEEHTSELQSLMRISYAVFCLNKKINKHQIHMSAAHN